MPDARARAVYSVCAHESRHAVSAWALGMRVLRAGRIGRSGYCEYLEPPVIEQLWSTGRPVRPATLAAIAPAVEQCMLVILSGPAGEDAGPADPGCTRDLANTEQLWNRWRQVNTAWIPPAARRHAGLLHAGAVIAGRLSDPGGAPDGGAAPAPGTRPGRRAAALRPTPRHREGPTMSTYRIFARRRGSPPLRGMPGWCTLSPKPMPPKCTPGITG